MSLLNNKRNFFYRNHELKIHKKHTAPHTCPRCDEPFKNKVTLKDHMKKVHNEKYEIETVNRGKRNYITIIEYDCLF